MATQAATALYLALVVWLFLLDSKYRPMTSPALWISILWWGIVGSRPISFWLTGASATYDNPDQYLEGSPVDAGVFLFLLILGLMALSRRGARLAELWRDNSALFLFMTYCLISVAWSDYPMVAAKRWIKDCGNIVAILLIATDADPRAAVRAVLARYMYLVIPTSVMLIKYYPEIGRYYDRWTWTPVLSGITTEKNALGAVAMLTGIFLVWDFVYARHADRIVRGESAPDGMAVAAAGSQDERTAPAPAWGRIYFGAQLLVFGMTLWLLHSADSSTALVCMLLGSGMVVALGGRSGLARHVVSHMWLYSFLIVAFSATLILSTDILQVFFDLLGEDATLTGRTDLWADVIALSGSPLLGSGYQSFWLGGVAQAMWEKYYFHPTQAHNGYIETYLNGGAIGLVLLLIFLCTAAARLRKRLAERDVVSALLFPILIVSLFYNVSEAIFNRLSLIWLGCLLACLNYRRYEPETPQSHTEGNERGSRNLERRPA